MRPLITALGLLEAWELLVRLTGVPTYILPPPSRIASVLVPPKKRKRPQRASLMAGRRAEARAPGRARLRRQRLSQVSGPIPWRGAW